MKKFISLIVTFTLLLCCLVACDFYETPEETKATTSGLTDPTTAKSATTTSATTTSATTTSTTTDGKENDMKVTIATFNIANGRDCNYDFSILAKDILDSGAEIVGLQEVDMFTSRNLNQNTLKKLSDATGYKYYAYSKAIDYKGGEYGNAILSKHPIVKHETIKLSASTTTEEKRVLLHAVIEVNNTSMDFFVTHIQSTSANLQFTDINTQLKKCYDFILMGDFNKTPDSDVYSLLENSYMLNTANDNITHTTKDNHDFDNIIPRTGVKCVDPRVINTGHSDHYMFLADWILSE